MEITFIGQGFEPVSNNSLGNIFNKLFKRDTYHTFTGISAFASKTGIQILADNINNSRSNFVNINLIVGIDQDGTSLEALNEVLRLNINSYIFYQTESPIFHTKLYLFEGIEKTSIIIGSSNLTLSGLYSNIESSLLIEFHNDEHDGQNLLKDIKDYYRSLFDFTDPNLFKITESTIRNFVDYGLVPSKTERKNKYRKIIPIDKSGIVESKLTIPNRIIFDLRRIIRKFSIGNEKRSKNEKTGKILSKKVADEFGSLVWQKKNLPSSDAQQVKGGTNIIGVIRLSDARFKIDEKNIDRNTYFRNGLFKNLIWKTEIRPNNTPLEIAYCNFHLIINKNELGIHELKISHDPARIAGQNNVPTTIHWGNEIISYLKDNSIIGMTFNLYYNYEENLFTIIIE